MSPQPQCVWTLGAELGEGPLWSAREGALWFVDIKQSRVHRFVPHSGDGRSWEAWIRKYASRKAAGETNIELVPESLD